MNHEANISKQKVAILVELEMPYLSSSMYIQRRIKNKAETYATKQKEAQSRE